MNNDDHTEDILFRAIRVVYGLQFVHFVHTNTIFDLHPAIVTPDVAGLAGVTVHSVDPDSRVVCPELDETLVTFEILLVN